MAPNSAILRLRRPTVEHAVGRVYDHDGLRNIIAAIVDKAVEIEALAHVAEEILLRPSSKHGRRQHRSRCPVVGGQECRLMPALAELAALAHPQTVAELGAALGKLDRDLLPRGHAYLGCDELIRSPILARIFV